MTKRPPLELVVAVSRNGVIGHRGTIPWHEPEDLRHFRRLTDGHAVLMGRKTHASIGRLLPNRTNIVLTRSPGTVLAGAHAFERFDDALAFARSFDAAPRIIGGARVYDQAMPLATTLHVTELDRDVEGDTFFSVPASEFDVTSRRSADTPGLTFVTYSRRETDDRDPP